MKRRPWTKPEIAIVKRDFPHMPTAQLASSLNRSLSSTFQCAYGLGLNKSAEFRASPASGRLVKGYAERGRASRFVKGQKPWNTGTKGIMTGGLQTQFKKGQRSGIAAAHWVPIGSYRINTDGYLDRKVRDDGPAPKRWVAVHRMVWMETHGPIPAGHAVTFKPGRASTELTKITLDALELVSRQDLMRRNSYHTNYPKEIAQLIQLRGAVQRQINRRERHEKPD